MKRMWSKNELKQLANEQVQEQVSSGQLQNVKVFEEIVDKDGHKRFEDFDGEVNASAPITGVYTKASLSGSHLLIVLAFSVANTSTLSNGLKLVDFTIPQWIYDKITPVWASVYIEKTDKLAYAKNWTSQTIAFLLSKESNNKIRIANTGTTTLTADRSVRVSFDILIDND